MTPREVVLAFWDAMQSNDFERASAWLSTDFEGHWPQSGELTRGRQAFARINTEYPAKARWHFQLNSIVCEGARVVTDVSVTDGTTAGRAITFHTVENGLITRQTEFWPDPFEAPAWRAAWVKVVDAPPFG
ncbi:MAG: nuclear transport factor 2 family protein [Pseudomonadota bacterium]